jgi:hypothetical protein
VIERRLMTRRNDPDDTGWVYAFDMMDAPSYARYRRGG